MVFYNLKIADYENQCHFCRTHLEAEVLTFFRKIQTHVFQYQNLVDTSRFLFQSPTFAENILFHSFRTADCENQCHF